MYKEFKCVICNFCEDKKFGEGGFGEVYLVRVVNKKLN